jgi:hypothetical protein
MQPPGTSSYGVYLLSILVFGLLSLVGRIHISTSHDISTWQTPRGSYDSAATISQALELALLHTRSDSDNTSIIVVNDRPTETDNKLT